MPQPVNVRTLMDYRSHQKQVGALLVAKEVKGALYGIAIGVGLLAVSYFYGKKVEAEAQ